MNMYPTITTIIRNICEWDEYLQSLGCSSHPGHEQCHSVVNNIPVEGGLQCLHVQVLRNARRKRRFVSKGNIRHLLWEMMKKIAKDNYNENWKDAPVVNAGGVLQLNISANGISNQEVIKNYPELDLFGYMYTAHGGSAISRKSVIGITKLEEVNDDLWRISFTIDTARLGRVKEGDHLVYDKEERKKRLRIVIEAIYKLFGKYPSNFLFAGALVRVPVPVFGTVMTCSKEELNSILLNGWVIKDDDNVLIQTAEIKDESGQGEFNSWLDKILNNVNHG